MDQRSQGNDVLISFAKLIHLRGALTSFDKIRGKKYLIFYKSHRKHRNHRNWAARSISFISFISCVPSVASEQSSSAVGLIKTSTEVSEEDRGARADAGDPDGGYTPSAPVERRGGQHRGCCRCHTKCRGCLLGLT